MGKQRRNRNNKPYLNNNSNNSRNTENKEFEMNVPFKDMNLQDMHVKFNKRGKNDLAWYQNLKQMLKDVASLPFGNPAGVTFDRFPNATTAVGNSIYTNDSVPGVMALRFVPTFGNPQSATDPMNLAAQQIYVLDRRANSGAKNYDKTDVMMVIGAMDNAYILYEYAVRAYKVISDFDYMNRYKPDTLIKAMGFNPSDLRQHLADFRYFINNFAYKLASINVPNQFDIIKRHSWMCSYVYMDSDLDKAQLYLFVPEALYCYTEGTDSAPTSLQMKYLYELANLAAAPATGYTVAQFADMVDALMNPILGSQDVGVISGDLAKALGENGMIKIEPIAENESLAPVYNEEVLHEIQNADLRNGIMPSSLTQNLTDLVSGPFLQENYTAPTLTTDREKWILREQSRISHALSVNSNDPTPELSTVATRFCNTIVYNDSTNKISVNSVGSEIITGAYMYYLDNGTTIVQQLVFPALDVGPTNTATEQQAIIVAMLMKFDWGPSIDFIFIPEGLNAVAYLGDTKDYANYTLVTDDALKRINDVAIMSLWKVKDFN